MEKDSVRRSMWEESGCAVDETEWDQGKDNAQIQGDDEIPP